MTNVVVLPRRAVDPATPSKGAQLVRPRLIRGAVAALAATVTLALAACGSGTPSTGQPAPTA